MKTNYKISHGMYVLTTNNAGCIVDAVSQVSAGDNPLISVAVNKQNYTNKMLTNNNNFVLSILDKNTDSNIIETFGFHTSKNYDKFAKIDTIEINNIKIPKDTIGYMYCEIIDMIDVETHTLFIGRIKKQELLKDTEEMTYNYYQKHKDEILKKVTTKNNKVSYICTICGYVYYDKDFPVNYKCPQCGAPAELFKKREDK